MRSSCANELIHGTIFILPCPIRGFIGRSLNELNILRLYLAHKIRTEDCDLGINVMFVCICFFSDDLILMAQQIAPGIWVIDTEELVILNIYCNLMLTFIRFNLHKLTDSKA